MTQIVFNLPTKETPGYLRRAKRYLELQEALSNPSAQAFDQLVDFLADFVDEPKDRDEAKDALLDASEEQLMSLFEAVGGGDGSGANPTTAAD